MQMHSRTVMSTAAGICAAGTAAGWSAPRMMNTLKSPATTVAGTQNVSVTTPIGTMAAPNYREIVACNKAAVVGIATVSERQADNSIPFEFKGPSGPSPFGDEDRNPLFRFLRAGISDGLMVEEAAAHAAEAGIQPGNVVLGVDGTVVRTPAELHTSVQHHKDHVASLIERGDSGIFMPVALG